LTLAQAALGSQSAKHSLPRQVLALPLLSCAISLRATPPVIHSMQEKSRLPPFSCVTF
jgi:hypothetical protein